MVDGAEFRITCMGLKLLRKAGRLELIQNSAPSTIVWCQCDIRIHYSISMVIQVLHIMKGLKDATKSIHLCILLDCENCQTYVNF